jgi:high-affinity iron transporter
MFPTFLITFREVLEALVIVSIIIGYLKKSHRTDSIRIVWLATFIAFALSFFLLVIGSFLGFQLSNFHSNYEEYIEGTLMFITVFFITWAIFFLHNNLASTQRKLTGHTVRTIDDQSNWGIFALIFTSVFREGMEIVLFLSTLFISTTTQNIIGGFLLGLFVGVLTAVTFYGVTQKFELRRITGYINIFLILFSGGLLMRAIHEFTDAGLIPNIGQFTLNFIPPASTFIGSVFKSILGITQKLNLIQISVYFVYILLISQKASIFHNSSNKNLAKA